jgi:diguanylate cyclase (GGDEF)-like protein
MKLSKRVLLYISLIWLGFLLLIYLGAGFLVDSFNIKGFLIYFTLMSIGTLIIIQQLLRRLIFNPLEKLKQDIHITTPLSRKNEISTLSEQINKILNTVERTNKELVKKLEKDELELETEIAERKTVEQALKSHREHLTHLAHYDDLTSLPNRIFFHEMLNKTINHAHRHKKMMAILFIDLDRFKNINEAFSRATADQVLKEIANRFSTVLRAGDTLARLDGDEFAVLLNDIGHAKFASPVSEKILNICSTPLIVDNHEITITSSIGICIYPNDGVSLEELQKNADIAMYKAKKSGGGVFQYYAKEMNFEAHEHIQLEAMLRKAINNNEFVLHYQPKLNLQDGTIEGVEALIRWENPELGLVNPTNFIPLAEETGLIMQIGEWALREACSANKAWQQQGYKPVRVAVNLSPKQFQHQDIAQLVASILTEVGLDAKYLELEITETAVMDDVESAILKLNDIQKMGVHIAIDDFGTGYTSISYLKKFPVNTIKIDQTFIKNIPNSQNDIAITNAIIALAKILKIKVVAEGVETADQLQYLADHDCDIVQGYYLSRPLPEQKIVLQFGKVSTVEEQLPS